MAKRKAFRIEKSRTPIIATTMVLFGGVVTCLAIAAPFSQDMRYPLLMIAGMFLGISLLLGILRKPTGELLSELYTASAEKKKKKATYRPKKIKPIQQSAPCKPPTAETIREIRGL